MRAYLPLTTLALAGLVSSCEASPPEAPPLDAPLVYRLIPASVGADHRTLSLYRADTFVEIRAHQPDGRFIGRSTGSLSQAANEDLTQLWEQAVDLGEIPKDVPVDSPLVELSLPGLTVTYALDYPPSGLAEIDAFLHEILDDMSQCRGSTRLVPDEDCEQLAPYPE